MASEKDATASLNSELASWARPLSIQDCSIVFSGSLSVMVHEPIAPTNIGKTSITCNIIQANLEGTHSKRLELAAGNHLFKYDRRSIMIKSHLLIFEILSLYWFLSIFGFTLGNQ